ncbi:MAG: hypothetical protein IJW30_03695 [Clostridia bacterium]|nr:hypothetical protein [Clostridia bacterium]
MKYGKRNAARAWGNRLIRIYVIAACALAAILFLSVSCALFEILPSHVLMLVTFASLLAFAVLALVLAVCAGLFAGPLSNGVQVNAPMPVGFCRLKRKIYRATLVRTLACVLAAGIGASAAYLALVRLQEKQTQIGYCIAIGLGSALVALAVALLIQRPSEQRVAGVLDRRFGLQEKVQTMLAFRNSEQTMVQLQRADTDERLRSVPNRQLRQHSVWVCLVAFVLSVAMMTGALLIPTTAEESKNEQQDDVQAPAVPSFELSDWQITALENLIAEVRASRMEEQPRAEMVSDLEQLLESLRTTETLESMKAQVIASILHAEEIADNANTHDDIYGKMRVSREKNVQMLADAVKDLKDAELNVKMDALRAKFTEATGATALSRFAGEIQRCLSNAEIPAEDALGIALDTLASRSYAIAVAWTESWSTELDDAFAACHTAMADALAQQLENSSVAQIVRLRLMEIFDIAAEEIPERGDSDLLLTDEEEDEKENTESDGAPGKGDILYGSKDVIYYPDDNTHLEYGSVFSEYFAKKEEQLRGDDYNDEMKEAINKYFEALYGAGVKEDTTEEN